MQTFMYNGLTWYRINAQAAYLLDPDIRVFSSWTSKTLEEAKRWDLALHPDGTVCVTVEFFVRLARNYFKVVARRLPYIGKLFFPGPDQWVPTFVPYSGLVHTLQLVPTSVMKARAKAMSAKQRATGKRKKLFY